MISVEKALKTVLENIKTLGSETVKLTCSLERVSAEDIYSGRDIPSFDNSAMDGYAVRASDIRQVSKARPAILNVIDDLKAGDVPKKILKKGQPRLTEATPSVGQAIRIMTGAMIPRGADSVVMVEDTELKSEIRNLRRSPRTPDSYGVVGPKFETNPKNKQKEFVKIYKEVNPGENIRKRGEDIKKGERVIQKGTLLKSAHIGILASLGIFKIKVVRKPKVAILATGDEVVDVGRRLTPGKLYSSNTYALYSQVIGCGAIPKNLGIAKDRPDELKAKIGKGLDCDIILTSGGVSVGDYDLVKSVLASMGTNIKFWKVAMRPGKPLAFGRIKGIPVFGLPGNPVSSMVSFEVFVKPAILKMLGQKQEDGNKVDGVLEEEIKKKKGLMYFLRARTQWNGINYLTRTTGPQGSGILKSMALANSLIILPEEAENIDKGARVAVRFLE